MEAAVVVVVTIRIVTPLVEGRRGQGSLIGGVHRLRQGGGWERSLSGAVVSIVVVVLYNMPNTHSK